MKQNLDFPMEVVKCEKAFHVHLEPGDGTSYRFVIVQLPNGWWGEGWEEQSGPFVAAASDTGPLFPGMILPVRRVLDWWRETMDREDMGLEHDFISWIRNENHYRLKENGGCNPWTVRAALLAILKTVTEKELSEKDMRQLRDTASRGQSWPQSDSDGLG